MSWKFQSIIFIALLLMIGISEAQEKESDFPVLKGPYIGQKPPGMTPEIFAPGIVSTDHNEGCSGFINDGKLFIFRRTFSRNSDAIYITELKDGTWTKPYPAPFKSKVYDGDFTFAPDNKTLYFTSRRSPDNLEQSSPDSNIWVVTKTDEGWSEPRMLESPINSEHHDSYPSVTAGGTLYFFCRGRGGFGESDIFRSRFIGGKYAKIENLGELINTEYHEWDPFIAPDESFLIFCSTRPGGLGRDDLYITFQTKNGAWTEPVNMGEEINSPESENRPSVTPDGKYFFFTSNKTGNREIYWVDAKIIDRFRPKQIE